LLLLSSSVIKQIATAVHFFALLGLAFTYILEDKENMFYIGIATGISGVLAFFIPPTGLIQPDDAPGTEYAKTAMSWQVNPEQVAQRIMEERAAEKKKAAEEEEAAKKVTKSKKKA
jgi:predicted GIY-YIG superfamily endonuclease